MPKGVEQPCSTERCRPTVDRIAPPGPSPQIAHRDHSPPHRIPSATDSPSDAVTTYFEQLARVPLLTREGEVDLARRIEDGERRALRAIVGSPVGARELAVVGRAAPRQEAPPARRHARHGRRRRATTRSASVRAIAEALERAGILAGARSVVGARRARRSSRRCSRCVSPSARSTASWQAPARHARGPGQPRSGARSTRRSSAIRAGGGRRRAGQGEPHRGEPAPRGVDREALPQPRAAPARPRAGGQPRPDARGRQVRVQARLQVQHVRELVDPPERQPRHQRPGAHHSHPGPHGRDAQQALEDPARHGAGGRRGAHAGGSSPRA